MSVNLNLRAARPRVTAARLEALSRLLIEGFCLIEGVCLGERFLLGWLSRERLFTVQAVEVCSAGRLLLLLDAAVRSGQELPASS